MGRRKSQSRPTNETKRYGCRHQFQPPVHSRIRVESRNARAVAEATRPGTDRDRTVPDQPGSRFLDLRDADHSERASANLNDLPGRSFVAMVAGTSALLVGTALIIAAFLY